MGDMLLCFATVKPGCNLKKGFVDKLATFMRDCNPV